MSIPPDAPAPNGPAGRPPKGPPNPYPVDLTLYTLAPEQVDAIASEFMGKGLAEAVGGTGDARFGGEADDSQVLIQFQEEHTRYIPGFIDALLAYRRPIAAA